MNPLTAKWTSCLHNEAEINQHMIFKAYHKIDCQQKGVFLLVSLACLGFQTMLGFYLGYWQHLEMTKSFPPDAKTYYEVANWLFGVTDFEHVMWSIATRPIGYPLILGLSERIAPSAIIVMQIIFWCLAQLSFFKLLLDRIGSLQLSLFITTASVTCLTFAVLPFVPLSETLAISFLMFSLYFAHRYDFNKKDSSLLLLLLSMSIGVTIRPAGMYPLIIVSIGGLIVFRKKKKHLAIGFLCLLPTIVQVGLFYKHFGIMKTSIIDSLAIDHYLLSRTDALLHKVPLPQAREVRRSLAYYPAFEARQPTQIAPYDKYAHDQLWAYLKDVPEVVIEAYRMNVEENITSSSAFLEILARHPALRSISLHQNIVLSHLGVLLAAFSVFFVGIQAFVRRSALLLRKAGFELFTAGLLLYCLLISGLSYWQGDRLSLPAYQPALILTGIWAVKAFQVGFGKMMFKQGPNLTS